jgi:UDP-N-acetylglucosamine 2-epimerase
MKTILVVGTRPHFVKASVLLEPLQKSNIETILVHTGQHYSQELEKVFFDELKLRKPDYCLNVGSGSFKHQISTGAKLLNDIIKKEKPDTIIGIGDSNPVMVASIGAITTGTKFAHIEAGLRSQDYTEQEEKNRIFADSVADVMFCSTEENKNNLASENHDGTIYKTGDLLVDAFKKYTPQINLAGEKFKKFQKNGFYLFTAHRKTNVYDPKNLEKIVRLLSKDWGLPIVWAIHPGVRKELEKSNFITALEKNKSLHMFPAQGYFEFQWLIRNSRAVITDAVGPQVEAYLSKTPCITIREKIEHKPIENLGWSKRVSLDDMFSINIERTTDEMRKSPHDETLFGMGNAGDLIARNLLLDKTKVRKSVLTADYLSKTV